MASLDYRDKTALIAGGSAGIGFALAEALARRSVRIAVIGSDAARAQQAAGRLQENGAVALGYRLDVTDRDGWRATAALVEEQLGPIDLLVLNAGAQGSRKRIEDIAPGEWDWVWSVNVNGIYNGLAACLPGMRERARPAHILITASIASFLPRATVSAYGASKAAALALAQSVRLELDGSPIGISVLCPGLVKTSIAETMRRHAPDADENTFSYMTDVIDGGQDPAAVAEVTLNAMAEGQFYIFTHSELAGGVLGQQEEIKTALQR